MSRVDPRPLLVQEKSRHPQSPSAVDHTIGVSGLLPRVRLDPGAIMSRANIWSSISRRFDARGGRIDLTCQRTILSVKQRTISPALARTPHPPAQRGLYHHNPEAALATSMFEGDDTMFSGVARTWRMLGAGQGICLWQVNICPLSYRQQLANRT